jgi:hypothetical protein
MATWLLPGLCRILPLAGSPSSSTREAISDTHERATDPKVGRKQAADNPHAGAALGARSLEIRRAFRRLGLPVLPSQRATGTAERYQQ